MNDVTSVVNKTDSGGIARIVYKPVAGSSGTLEVEKEGYYVSSFPDLKFKTSPHGEMLRGDIDVVLKRKVRPVSMAATRMTSLNAIIIPQLDQIYGYDLEVADFTGPKGKGKVADLLIKVSGVYVENGDSQLFLEITFSNPLDGVIEFDGQNRESGSVLLSEQGAPEHGYVSVWQARYDSQNKNAYLGKLQGLNFYFRVRTKTDESGNIISAHYGKIYGPIRFGRLPKKRGGVAQLDWEASYFNPVANDRSVEFDEKRNLLKNGHVLKP